MRILFFNYEYPPLGGGAGNATAYILREFSRMENLEVDLVTSSHDNDFHLERIGENVKIHKLPIGKNGKNLHYQSQKELLVYARKAYVYAKKLTRENKYDLSHSFFSIPCGFLSLLLKRRYKLPYIVSLRGADVPGYSERFTLIYGLLTPLIRLIWKKADAVISNSRGLRELALQTNAKQEIDIIYNGIDTAEFFPGEAGKQAPVILCVSRLTPRKGINYLIEAMPKISKKIPEVKLKIAGEGDAKNDLENQARNLKLDNVEFVGRVAHKDLAKIYREASVFVLPSLNEGMSNTMLEALASGLPLVATDTGGTRELVENGRNGFIVKMKDASDLAEKIITILADSESQKQMAEVSRKKAEGLSWKNVAEKYKKLYEKIGALEKE